MGCARVLFTEKEEVGRFLENLQNGHSTNNTTAAKRKRRGRTNFLRESYLLGNGGGWSLFRVGRLQGLVLVIGLGP